jgi:hypothetical protein
MKGLKKYIRRERRSSPRHTVCTEVEFYAWDEVKKKPRTDKAQGCITEVSLKGACLQTNHLQMGDYHLFLDHDPKGKTVLAVEVPSPSDENPWLIRAQVVSYDKFPEWRKYQFDVRLQFVNLSTTDLKNLEQLIKSQTSQ